MHLKSNSMQLSAKERRWLPWFGINGKLSLGWSCFVNRSMYPAVEQTFEGIAATRVKLLQNWTNNQWQHLVSTANIIDINDLTACNNAIQDSLKSAQDFSELFIIDTHGKILTSTHDLRINLHHGEQKAIEQALQGQFLHGPYADPETLTIGPSSSHFHDEVTLMFYQPIVDDDKIVGFLCARVPNDVLGDLIQREAGHVYRESGDNYLFMVESRFDPQVKQGIALSRSRFEDNTFSHGENLKSGVHTKFGVVKVDKHTELEVRFTDPATGELHPGVRETIKNGHNLFVTYPAYSDYRHIPVIGKGVTFKLHGSLDTWGMMCEGDLEEVYRRRSINFALLKTYFAMTTSVVGLNIGLLHYTDLSLMTSSLITGAGVLVSGGFFAKLCTNKLSNRLNEMTSVIRTIAEGEGNLTQRLDQTGAKQDETGEMSRWINSFIDNLDSVVGQVIHASKDVRKTNEDMLDKNAEAYSSSNQVHQSMQLMQTLIQKQSEVILQASHTAQDMKQSMASVVEKAKSDYEDARAGTQAIRDIVENTATSVQSIDSRMKEIGNIIEVITEITNQTNLLALNAAIEAARAGEHGRGFSVVADEVRGLAGRTAEAAKDIQSMIQGLQRETLNAVNFMESGVKDVDQSLKLTEAASGENIELHAIVEKMFETINVIEQNSARNGETAQQVTQVTEVMASSIHQLSKSSEQVNTTASRLQQLMGTFQVSAH
ncbi:methyl-accepting chemotaxis protein [Neptunomonas phycophila]|uniref:Methyl-accepting chemotaxis protein n=1 Tax=Neptunomonas phycophila TaxID=1572645 RepID=A0AAW7XEY7_9GAMM|nr:methyl-accepting chemotaxis protein [Neptunomonas phycophila]MDO6452789.1 methyl-accepting chemotaxis protein [Neptunomonas phycophila]